MITPTTQIELYHPNEFVYNEYGSPADPDSLLAKSQFLFVRHGESYFNDLAKKTKFEL